MTSEKIEKLKRALFMESTETRDDFCGMPTENLDDDAIENIMDQIIDQMPQDEFERFYEKYIEKNDAMKEKLTFTISGEFITSLAREKCFTEKNIPYAFDLLENCTRSSVMTKDEQRSLIIDILEGRNELRGTYPEDYGLYDTPEETGQSLRKLLGEMKNETDAYRKKYETLMAKLDFIKESLYDYQIEELSVQWEQENPLEESDPHLFENPPKTDTQTVLPENKPKNFDMKTLLSPIPGIRSQRDTSSMLKSYLQHIKDQRDDDYGFLFPDGTFYPVDWGEHNTWAYNWLLKNDPEFKRKDRNDPGLITNAAGYLCDNYHVVLLHSPYQGIAEVTKNENHRLTKRQQQYLIEYYEKRNLHDKAAAVCDII